MKLFNLWRTIIVTGLLTGGALALGLWLWLGLSSVNNSEVSAAAASVLSQADPVFMKFDGIEGESTDDKHKDEIDILAWGWGLDRSGLSSLVAGRTRALERADFRSLTLKKGFDKSSPLLMEHIATGEPIRQAALAARRPGEENDYLLITLDQVMLESYRVEQASPDAVPVEEISLNYQKITVEYAQDPDDTGRPKVRFSWDVAANQAQ